MARKSARIEWAGVDELRRTFEKAGLALDDKNAAVKDVLIDPCDRAMAHARSLIHDVTGTLSAAVYTTKGGPKQRGILMGVRKKKAYYAGFVEFGTSKMAPKPFFRPALLAMHPTFVSDIAPGIKKIVESAAAQAAYHPPK
jgi:HK97 gp10 family phage protein